MEYRAKDLIAKLLGAIWIFDGLLQFQPHMFDQVFVTNVLQPVLEGQPAFMAAIVQWGIALWNTNTIVTDTLAALLQIGIGVLLFFPLTSRTFKLGLWVSIVWGMIVWLCGEGAGLLLTGNAGFYTGAPGAVTIYVLLAVLLLKGDSISTTWYPKIAGWLCLLGAALQIQPMMWDSQNAMMNFMPAMNDPVTTISALPNYVANLTGLAPVQANLLLATLLLLVGVMLLWKQNRTTGIVALIFLFVVWWLGQDFGQLSMLWVGTPTDPNTAPMIALILVPIFIRGPHPRTSVSTVA